tara:strand:+ start:10928 stop:11287 length:360 start_codon:yes stop_codon:yes gene_type:complete
MSKTIKTEYESYDDIEEKESYDDGAYRYRSKVSPCYFSLIIDGKDVLEGKKATYCLYDFVGNKKWIEYQHRPKKEGPRYCYYMLIIDGKDILEGHDVRDCTLYEDGSYSYNVTVEVKNE